MAKYGPRKVGLIVSTLLFLLLLPAPRAEGWKAGKPSLAMVPVDESDRPSIHDDCSADSLDLALRRSLDYYRTLPEGHRQRFGPDYYTQHQMIETLEVAITLLEASNRLGDPLGASFHELFRFYRASGSKRDGSVLFTGYYEPVLSGSLVENETFNYPIYGVPEEVRRGTGPSAAGGGEVNRALGEPFFTRKEIEKGKKLSGRGLEIAWVDDPVDLFFLQVQGSGRISLSGGGTLGVGYAANNGHPYYSIGKYLLSRGKIEKDDATLSGIKRYLRTHPKEMHSVLWLNKRYIFFKETTLGPVGNIDVQLTADRSIAMDAGLFPRGALAYFETEIPVIDDLGKITGWRSTSRLSLIQDTGAAIQGPGRVDIFFGSGREAEEKAGSMMRKGSLYILVLK